MVAGSIAKDFGTFDSRIVVDLRDQDLKKIEDEIVAVVQKQMKASGGFSFGSYPRQTACRPLHDIDIMVEFEDDRDYWIDRHPSELLKRLNQVMSSRYQRARASKIDGQAVRVEVGAKLVADVVPGYRSENERWAIPSLPDNYWVSTDPKAHEKLVQEANERTNGLFCPVVRMLKAWNQKNGSLLKGFHLELMAYQVLTRPRPDERPMTYPRAFTLFFEEGQDLLKNGTFDPTTHVGQGDDGLPRHERIDQYLSDSERATVISLFVRDLPIARLAERHGHEGNFTNARLRWVEIFGSLFPAARDIERRFR